MKPPETIEAGFSEITKLNIIIDKHTQHTQTYLKAQHNP